MTRVPVTHEKHTEDKIKRKHLLISLGTGIVLGIFGGIPLGWLAHSVYYQQQSGMVLLCRQKHIGQPEAELKALCGTAY